MCDSGARTSISGRRALKKKRSGTQDVSALPCTEATEHMHVALYGLRSSAVCVVLAAVSLSDAAVKRAVTPLHLA
jgi:hypothetical protein